MRLRTWAPRRRGESPAPQSPPGLAYAVQEQRAAEPWAGVSSFPRHSELLGVGSQADLLLPDLFLQAPAPLSGHGLWQALLF